MGVLPSHRSGAELYHVAVHGHSQTELTTAGEAVTKKSKTARLII